MHCHEEFTAEEIEDCLRELARKRAKKKKKKHTVPSSADFLRIARVMFHGEEDTPPPVIRTATVSWKDP
jgi:hypothetical protein